MTVINMLIALIIVGILLWLVNWFIPMDEKIKSIMNAVIVIAVVLWLLSVFGVIGSMTYTRIGN